MQILQGLRKNCSVQSLLAQLSGQRIKWPCWWWWQTSRPRETQRGANGATYRTVFITAERLWFVGWFYPGMRVPFETENMHNAKSNWYSRHNWCVYSTSVTSFHYYPLKCVQVSLWLIKCTYLVLSKVSIFTGSIVLTVQRPFRCHQTERP